MPSAHRPRRRPRADRARLTRPSHAMNSAALPLESHPPLTPQECGPGGSPVTVTM